MFKRNKGSGSRPGYADDETEREENKKGTPLPKTERNEQLTFLPETYVVETSWSEFLRCTAFNATIRFVSAVFMTSNAGAATGSQRPKFLFLFLVQR